jgi:hypothetical protein
MFHAGSVYELNYFILCMTKKLRKTICRKAEDHVGSATTQGGRGKSPLNVLYYLARTHGRKQDGRIASNERRIFFFTESHEMCIWFWTLGQRLTKGFLPLDM